MESPNLRAPKVSKRGFTLVEVVMCIAVVTLIFGGIITGYVQTGYRAEWSGYSLAAQALAIQQLEQARAAKWDTLDQPVADEITNIFRVTSTTLDLPISGTNAVWATNYCTVSLIAISTNPAVSVYMVKVDTVWPFLRKGLNQYFTNTVAAYYAPD
jgi:prepilin-type N-terminal cleavage/methylation domain-containing protein